jgi:hypothetical protein
MMRILLTLALAAIAVFAQAPAVLLKNATRPESKDFQTGDRFEIVITGGANQPVSVRTTRRTRTDWGPVIGWTDGSGHWSTAGQFEKSDFGDWAEVWTVGAKIANPALHFWVGGACLKDGQGFLASTGCCTSLSRDTAWGPQTFATPSDPDPFRTPDGRLVPGRERSRMTAEQHHAEVMQYLISSPPGGGTGSGEFGDQAGALIAKIIGVNALSEDETRNVLAIIHAAFEKPDRIPEEAKTPSATVLLLLNLANSAGSASLKQEIAETMAFLRPL